MQVQVIDHPLVQDRLLSVRDRQSNPDTVRSALFDIATMLVYETARTLTTRSATVETPIASAIGSQVDRQPVIVPILRGGLGMSVGAQAILPHAPHGFIGLARHPETHEPQLYMNTLPADMSASTVYVLDPMLASGRSVEFACRLIAERGCADMVVICAIAAHEGIDLLERTGLPIRVVTAAIDPSLNEDGYVIPGMGDAGDRQFDEGNRTFA